MISRASKQARKRKKKEKEKDKMAENTKNRERSLQNVCRGGAAVTKVTKLLWMTSLMQKESKTRYIWMIYAK